MERKPSAIKQTSEKFAARMKSGTDSPVLQKILSQSGLKSGKHSQDRESRPTTIKADEKPKEVEQQSQGKDADKTPPSTSLAPSNKNRQRPETQQLGLKKDKEMSGNLPINSAVQSQERLQPLKYEPPAEPSPKSPKEKKEDVDTDEQEQPEEEEEESDGVPFYEKP